MQNQRGTEPHQLMTVKEAAAWLKVHPNTLRRWTEIGLLKAFRVGPRGDRRFERKEIERMLAEFDGAGDYPKKHS